MHVFVFLPVFVDHLPHPVRFPSDIAIVRAVRSTALNQQTSILRKRACRGNHHLRIGRHGIQRSCTGEDMKRFHLV